MKMFRIVFPGLLAAALMATPLLLTEFGKPARAAVALQTNQTCTPDQIVACVNGAIQGVNQGAVTCTTTGCTGPASGPNSAPPVITGTCATAGAGAGFALSPNATAFSGKVQCASTANTTLVATWANARVTAGGCVWTAETVAITLPMTSVTTALTSFAYASTASPVFDYVCGGL